jgi:hypothetical protein
LNFWLGVIVDIFCSVGEGATRYWAQLCPHNIFLQETVAKSTDPRTQGPFVDSFKARLVTQGLSQILDVDFGRILS